MTALRIFLAGLIIWCTAHISSGQDTLYTLNAPKDTTYWTSSYQAGTNFHQAAFSSNWIGGGTNNTAIGGFANGKFQNQKGRWNWDNDLDFEYGIVRNAGQDFRKSNDKLYLDTKVGRGLSKNWDLFGSLSFLTQFSEGFKYAPDSTGRGVARLVSDFLSPGYLTSAIGLEFKKGKMLSVRIGAFSNRITFVLEDSLFVNEPTNYGVRPGRDTRIELVATQLLCNFDFDFNKDHHFKVRYQLFANYENFGWHRIDHRVEAAFTSKVNKYINFNISGIMIYDRDQHAAVQLSQAIAVGVLFKHNSKKNKKG